MAERIMLTPENLDQKADELRKYEKSQQDAFANVETLINGLVQGWEGDAQQAFMTSYQSNKTVFDQFIVDMERFAKFMNEFATTMRMNEKGGVTKAQALA